MPNQIPASQPNKLSRRAVLAAASFATTATTMLQNSQAESAAYRIIDPHVHAWTDDPQSPFANETRIPPA